MAYVLDGNRDVVCADAFAPALQVDVQQSKTWASKKTTCRPTAAPTRAPTDPNEVICDGQATCKYHIQIHMALPPDANNHSSFLK
jgi:hypothetical protein